MTASHFPGQPHFHREAGQLHVERLPLAQLAREHGTPLFVYSKASMLDALAAYQRGFAGRKVKICYAMKANSSLGVLQVFAQAGCGFDIVSGGELERVLAAATGAALLLGACGQKGPLYLPASDAGRATLTQTLTSPAAPASAPPATGTASPVRTP